MNIDEDKDIDNNSDFHELVYLDHSEVIEKAKIIIKELEFLVNRYTVTKLRQNLIVFSDFEGLININFYYSGKFISYHTMSKILDKLLAEKRKRVSNKGVYL